MCSKVNSRAARTAPWLSILKLSYLTNVVHELQEEYFAMNTTQTMLNRITDTTCSLKRQDTCTIHRAINHKNNSKQHFRKALFQLIGILEWPLLTKRITSENKPPHCVIK